MPPGGFAWSVQVMDDALEVIEASMVGMLKPEFEEIVTGEAEVRVAFSVPRVGTVAGCYVRNGTITRGSKAASCATAL